MKTENYSFLVIPLLILLALGGWGWAFMLRGEVARQKESGGEAAATGKSRGRGGERHGSIAALLPTGRSARLLAGFEDIAGAARPGEVNDKLIAACRQTLLDPEFSRRQRDFMLLVDLMRPEDAAALHETFLELHRQGRGFGPEYGAFAYRWGEIDAEGALEFLTREEPLRLPAGDLGNIVRGWAQIDPLAALRWMDEHPDIAESREGWSSAVNGWLRSDNEAATAYLLQKNLPREQTVQSVRYGAIEKLYSTGAEDALDWIAAFPDDEDFNLASRVAWHATVGELREMSYEDAASAWSRVGGEPWMTFDDFARFSGTTAFARVNAEGEDGFLAALQKSWPAEKAAAQFERWQQTQPDHVSRWLARFPDHPYAQEILLALGEEGPR
jgi:hypothetical protein